MTEPTSSSPASGPQPNPEPVRDDARPTNPEQPTSSLFSRLMNIFAAPGEVYEEVKNGPARTGNWLAPTLTLIVVSWIGVEIIFSQDAIKQQLNDLQAREVEKQIEKGKFTKAQAEQARAAAERFGGIAT